MGWMRRSHDGAPWRLQHDSDAIGEVFDFLSTMVSFREFESREILEAVLHARAVSTASIFDPFFSLETSVRVSKQESLFADNAGLLPSIITASNIAPTS